MSGELSRALRAASQALTVARFACARQTRSMLARAHPGSRLPGRASTSAWGRWWSVVKKVSGSASIRKSRSSTGTLKTGASWVGFQ